MAFEVIEGHIRLFLFLDFLVKFKSYQNFIRIMEGTIFLKDEYDL